MGARYAICIGVANAIPNVPLSGAINDAIEFSNWAKVNGYQTTLITDEQGPVTFNSIQSVVFPLAKNGEVDRLIIFFAGHGAEQDGFSQYWLLSDWKENPNEAINVSASSQCGSTARIRQIAIVADACRNAGPATAKVIGGSIFPSLPALNGPSPKWDKFLAVVSQAEAQGVEEQNGVPGYGIFTRCLLKALKFEDQDAITTHWTPEPAKERVCSDELAVYLEQAVPRLAIELGGAVQRPEVIAGWIRPNDAWAERDLPPQALLPPRDVMRAQPKAKPKTPSPPDSAVMELAKKLTELRPDSAMEGICVAGSEYTQIVRPNHMKLAGSYGVRAAAVELSSSKWGAVAEISKHQTDVIVDADQTVSVTYTPTGARPRSNTYYQGVDEVIATMALDPRGPWHQKILSDPKFLSAKKPNINRALLAAYAFARVGDIKSIDNMMSGYLQPLGFAPFDVALLSSWSLQHTNGGSYVAVGPGEKKIPVAGTFPLMTPGWGYLDPNDANTKIDPVLFELRSGLVSGVWTTFDPKTGKEFAHHVKNGAI